MDEFGVLSLLLTLSAFLMYIFNLGSFQYLFKRVNEGEEAKKEAFWSSLIVTIGLGLIACGISAIFIDQISAYLNLHNYNSELILTISLTALTSVMMVFLFYHYSLGRNNFQNFLQFLRGSLWIIITMIVTLFYELTLVQTFIIINISMCITLLISIPWREIKDLRFNNFIGKISFKPLLRYCLPLMPYFAGVWGIPMIIRTQLNIYEGATSVAIFSVAYTLMEIVFMFISTITGTLSPYFFAEQTEKDKPGLLYNIMLKYSIICVVLIVPFIYLTRFDVIQLLTSKKYLIAGDYIPLLIFFPLLRVIIIVFEQVYLKEAKTFFLGLIYTAGMAISFLLSVFLIPKYSILGAIYASIVSYVFIFIALYMKQRSSVDFKYLKLYPVITLAAFLWAMVYFLNLFEFHSFIKAIPLLIVAIIGLFVLPVFTNPEKEKILVLLKIRK